ncbi:hypothetical protein AB0I49_27460 [Streptomyces sp. NPDC050617]|uniref:hypothetical protein n=1 Tax=Streptomyces sp. NPDC050617 TaxID=3154628 RepID=UPI003443C97A
MSEIAGTSSGVHPIAHPRRASDQNAHEAYAFACMKCGHGWEQSYEIEHHVDTHGRAFVVYYADGARVPSPLTTPTCANCGAHVVRIMRSGRVSMVTEALHSPPHAAPGASVASAPSPEPLIRGGHGGRDGSEAPAEPALRAGHHHWHLADLLKPFHHRK